MSITITGPSLFTKQMSDFVDKSIFLTGQYEKLCDIIITEITVDILIYFGFMEDLIFLGGNSSAFYMLKILGK